MIIDLEISISLCVRLDLSVLETTFVM